MHLAEYLLRIAARHEQAKEEHEEELKELRLQQRKGGRRRSFTLTHEDEIALLKGVIGSVRGRSAILKKVSLSAVGALAC